MSAQMSEYTSVPTTADLENNSNTKKYTVNQAPKGKIVLSKLACLFLVMGAIALAVISALAVFIFVPGCIEAAPEALTVRKEDVKIQQRNEEVDARLPRHLYPKHYKLQLTPFLIPDNFTTHGFISIEVDVKEATDKVVVNINDIVVDRESVRVKHSKDEIFLHIVDQAYNEAKQIYTIQLDRKMKKGEGYRIDMKFIGNLNDLNQGFYRSQYVDSVTNEVRWLASTQFSPTDARRAFPCFDEPDFKATFTISICRPENMTSLSNMPRVESIKSEEIENYYWDHYKETPPMSTYLVAFIVSDLQPYEFNITERSYTIWARKDAINQAIYSSTIAPKLIKYYEDYFNIKFPLPKIDFVAVPDFGFNAMENWGLITFRETVLLLDDLVHTIDNKRGSASTMAHEITHQWFGNLVTPQWWDDLWLKEGFASYFNYPGMHHIEPTWNVSNEFIISEMQEAFEIDGLKSARPLSFNVQNSNQIRQAFDKISYSKGASIIRMMHHFLGEETFRSALIHFLTDHQYANANHDNLWKALTDKAHNIGVLPSNLTVKEIMDTWTLKPGFPVINAIAEDENTVRISQSRFFYYGAKPQDESTWWVPLSYTSHNNPNFLDTKAKAWLNNVNETFISLDTTNWWLLNLHNTGYYIVNYDEMNWKRLLANFMIFPSSIRAQLVGNAMDLARANLFDYDIPFKMILKVGRIDNELVPFIVAFDRLEYLYNMLIKTPIFNEFDTYILAAFKSAFDEVGFNDSPTDSYTVQRFRRLILEWACKRPNSRCVFQSMHLYREWMTIRQPIAANLRRVVYCTAIREGGEAEWNFAYKEYLKTSLPVEKSILLHALGCTTQPWILTKYLGFMLDPDSGIRKQDGLAVFETVSANIAGHALAFDFLRSNWEEINDYYGLAFSRVAKMVLCLPTYMNTPYDLQELESFRDNNDLGTAKQAFDSVIETVEGNIQWMNTSYKSVETWLQSHKEHFGL